jgi:phosphatidylglycerophosphatase A
MTRLAVWFATAGPAGYSPIAPGTAGSVVGVLIYLAAWRASLNQQLLVLLVITATGIWAADVAARHFGKGDPSHVVIDEVAGQLLTFAGLSLGGPGILVGFLLFRLLDIIKPWPARQLESLHGGLGIMADDLMAAVYANLLLRGAILLFPGWL